VPLISGVSGTRDIVDHGRSGFLFEAGDLDDFVATLELMSRTAAESYWAMSNAARSSICQSFGIEQIAGQHLRIYRAALDRNIIPPR
jgi:glycosyltransferase involved in cell wall biosynthesis